MPTKSEPEIASEDPVGGPTATGFRVSVPQDSGTIVITTFDTKTPYRYTVTGGVIDAPTKTEADLLVARVDGAKLAS